MKDELDGLSDSDLTMAFAGEIAGWTKLRKTVLGAGAPERDPSPYGYPPGRNYECAVTPFATSADAVLPYLEKHPRWFCDNKAENYAVCVVSMDGARDHYGRDSAFARASCICLLRASRSHPQAGVEEKGER
jgi:hypothetical protein